MLWSQSTSLYLQETWKRWTKLLSKSRNSSINSGFPWRLRFTQSFTCGALQLSFSYLLYLLTYCLNWVYRLTCGWCFSDLEMLDKSTIVLSLCWRRSLITTDNEDILSPRVSSDAGISGNGGGSAMKCCSTSSIVSFLWDTIIIFKLNYSQTLTTRYISLESWCR